MMSDNKTPNVYFRQLMDVQYELYAHIIALLGSVRDVEDVLQNTNLRIAELVKDATDGEIVHFKAWAKKVAFFQVLTWRAERRRERLTFDSDLLAEVADQLAVREPATDTRLAALEQCLKKLPEKLRALVEIRYAAHGGVRQAAATVRLTPRAVTINLYRARLMLKTCIEQTVQGGGHG